MRLSTGVLFVFLAGCTSASAQPSPKPPATVELPPAEPLKPLTIVDAAPPVIAPKPVADPLLDGLVADSPTLRQDARQLARERPEATQQAAEKLIAIVRALEARDGRKGRPNHRRLRRNDRARG